MSTNTTLAPTSGIARLVALGVRAGQLLTIDSTGPALGGQRVGVRQGAIGAKSSGSEPT